MSHQVDEHADLLVDGRLAGVEGGDQAGDAAHHGVVTSLDHHALGSGEEGLTRLPVTLPDPSTTLVA